MRYYSVVLTPDGGSVPPAFPVVPGAQISGANWTSQVGGRNDPGALDVELDIITGPQDAPTGSSFFRLYGVSLQQIAQAAQLNPSQNDPNKGGVFVDIYAGMAKGLPLANPAQQGLIAHAKAYPAFANWIGVDMTLDLILTAPFGLNAAPANIVHNQPAGMPLGTAAKNALSTAFPKFTPQVSVSPKLVLPNDEFGFYATLTQYGSYLKQLSQKILGAVDYLGVSVAQQGKDIAVNDGTQPASNVIEIKFQDLIGQPTWLGFNNVSIKTAMRGDIKVLTQVKLPQTQATVAASSAPQFRQNSVFQGTFLVTQVHHAGRFRQPTGEAWVTIFECVSMPSVQ